MVNRLNIRSLDHSDILNTIEKAYIKSVEAFQDASYKLDTEIIHSWRKQAKTLLIQLKYSPLLPGQKPDNMIATLDNLTELLGKEHDLAVLEETLYSILDPEKEEKQKIHLLISKSRAKLQKKSFEIGKTLFSQEVLLSNRAYFTA
jgi:CHAD domain-containing protein